MVEKLQKIIGGMFGIPIDFYNECSVHNLLTTDSMYFVNARSAMWYLFSKIKPRRVWMPSYLCETMAQSLIHTDAKLNFYPINYDLQVADDDWICKLSDQDVVVFISYFGFPISSAIQKSAKSRGAIVLEDASQALLSTHVGKYADYVVYSPRKFIGVPDGGILINKTTKSLFGIETLHAPPAEWWTRAFYSSVLRREYDLHGGDNRWFEMFRKTENEYPVGSYAMSELSKMLLTCGHNYQSISRLRRENYTYLHARLSCISVLPGLADGVVPLGYPIRVNNRDIVQGSLFKKEIYPPVHWRLTTLVPKKYADSYKLSDKIMTIPCDQRYTHEDMDRVVAALEDYL